MADIVFINGNYYSASEAKISVFDRGLLFADSVYEVIPVYNGHLFYLEKHLKRLAHSLGSIRITQPDIQWQSVLEELIAQNGGGDMQIYLQVTRGNQGLRKHDIPSQITPTVIAFTMHNHFSTFKEKQQGLHAKLLEDIRWQRCDIKTTALIGNVLLNDDALSSGADTAILTRNGFLTEGVAANLFLVDQRNVIRTPPLTHFCLPGVTRDVIIELIKSLSWPLSEDNIPTEELFNAKELWITSASKEIYPIIRVNEQLIGNGQVGHYWRQLNEKYQQLIKKLYD